MSLFFFCYVSRGQSGTDAFLLCENRKSSVDLSGELFTATNSKLSTHAASAPAASGSKASGSGATDYSGAAAGAEGVDGSPQRKPRKSIYKAAMGAVRALLR